MPRDALDVTIKAAELPGGPLPGMDPAMPVTAAFDLAAYLGVKTSSLDRLIKRHRKELRNYGPLFEGSSQVEPGSGKVLTNFYLSDVQRDLLRLVSETASGVALRSKLLAQGRKP